MISRILNYKQLGVCKHEQIIKFSGQLKDHWMPSPMLMNSLVNKRLFSLREKMMIYLMNLFQNLRTKGYGNHRLKE